MSPLWITEIEHTAPEQSWGCATSLTFKGVQQLQLKPWNHYENTLDTTWWFILQNTFSPKDPTSKLNNKYLGQIWREMDTKQTVNICGIWEPAAQCLPWFSILPFSHPNPPHAWGSSCTLCRLWDFAFGGTCSDLTRNVGWELFGFLKHVCWKRKASQKQHHELSTN